MHRNRIFFFVLLLILVGNIVFRIFTYRTELTTKYDPTYWRDRYLQSQWVVSYSKNSIGDDGLYAYVGWEQIHGKDPTTLNAEIPPFGKYLIGVSEVLFGNQNIFALLSGIGVLIGLYFLGLTIFKQKIVALIPVVLFSFEPLFYTQLRAPFLDLLYLLLLILTFVFYLRDRYILSGIFLGLMMATKAGSATFVLVLAACFVYQLFRKNRKDFQKTLLMIPLSLVVFCLTYFQFFLKGHNLRQFLGVQKYILNFYAMGAKGHLPDVWTMLLQGKFIGSDGSHTIVSEWRIWWIALTLSLIVSWVFFIYQKEKGPVILIVIWSSIYLFFLTFSGVPVFPRYLLVVLPFLYNLVIYLCFRFSSKGTKLP